MLTVTDSAKEKLTEALQEQTSDPEIAIRIVPSPSEPNRLELVLDQERDGDQVVENSEGAKVLLIGPELTPALSGMVFDYQETSQGDGFTLSMSEPET